MSGRSRRPGGDRPSSAGMHSPGQWVKGPPSVVYDSLSEITVYDFEPVPVVPDVEPFSMWTRPDRVLSSQSFVSTMRSARPSRVWSVSLRFRPK